MLFGLPELKTQEKKTRYYLIVLFLGGQYSSGSKAHHYRLDGPGLIPGVRGDGHFPSFLRGQTGSGIHSASYKMSTAAFRRVKAAEHRN